MSGAPASPFREGLPRESAPPATTVVIFGATGDLTRRKLVPALYNLDCAGQLPSRCAIVGYARQESDRDGFIAALREGVAAHGRRGIDEAAWREFAGRLDYVAGEFADPAGMARLAATLARIDREQGAATNRLFYLATPPSFYPVLFERLAGAGLLAQEGGRAARVVVEKPFGRDLTSARELNRIALGVAAESQIFRIDHYLGKDTVQNLLVFRFANAIFEPLWNHKYVDHVQITVGESIGVEGRGRFYEEAGALRDIVQNHLLQILSLVAMEPPVDRDADSIRDEKVKVLRAIPCFTPREVAARVVRGQYGPGTAGDALVPGYRAEPGVAPDSTTETFVAAELAVDNWRWAGVPFYVRAGKRMARRVTEVAVRFRDVPHRFFGAAVAGPEPNLLTLRIQPEEGIALRFGAKVPGTRLRVEPVKMDFLYGSAFGADPPEAYERLLLDAMLGESTLFIRRDEVEAAWGIVSAIHAGWADEGPATFPNYEAGTWGPEAADRMLERAGRAWRRP